MKIKNKLPEKFLRHNCHYFFIKRLSVLKILYRYYDLLILSLPLYNFKRLENILIQNFSFNKVGEQRVLPMNLFEIFFSSLNPA